MLAPKLKERVEEGESRLEKEQRGGGDDDNEERNISLTTHN
jgi:hypothetical protein